MTAIRPAQESDLPAIQQIYAHHVLNSLTSFEEVPPHVDEMARRRAEIVGRSLPYLAAVNNGQVVGFAYAGPYYERSAYRFTVEDRIFVRADCIGQGVGTSLLGELVEYCAVHGYKRMVAQIGGADPQAMIFHEHSGFVLAGRLVDVAFKFGRWHDVVLMQRRLAE